MKNNHHTNSNGHGHDKMKATYEQLIFNNRVWVDQKLTENPNYFRDKKTHYQPSILWIGCSDSCTSAEEITGTSGDLFIYQNIANMVVYNDMNMLSIIDFAVSILEVDQVIICGHYGCKGIKTAMDNLELGIVDHWMNSIRNVYRLHQKDLDDIEDLNTRWKRFVELNVIEQMVDLSKTTILRKALKERKLEINGCVYDSDSGILNSLGTLFKEK